MTTRVRIIFNRKKTATRSTAAPISIEVYHNRNRKYLSTGISVKIQEWDKIRGEIVNRKDQVELNRSLILQRRKVLEAINEMADKKEAFSFELLRATLFGESAKERSFTAFVEERIEKRKIQDSTKKQHKVLLEALKKSEIINLFSDLKTDNVKRFDDYIREKHSTHQPTVHDYHKRLKIYVNEAIKFGYITTDPYLRFKTDKGKSKGLKYLNKEELRTIEEVELHDAFLQRVRDVFIFCCYTGLAYSDLKKFNFSEALKEGDDYYVIDRRIKTDESYYIMLLPKAMAVLKKYDYTLPVISNVKYNLYLKVVASHAKLKKKLTSHVARHTFATTITLSNNVPIEIVARMLGHAKIETTQRYAKVLAEDVKKQFQRLKSEL